MSLALVHIGMMKAGSTWLHHWLSAHPELAAPFDKRRDERPGKNPYFWNRDDPHGRHPRRMKDPMYTPEEYRAAVDSVPKAIDVTDSYSFMPLDCIKALKEAHPDVLVTYCARDPIETLWSYMRMHHLKPDDVERGEAQRAVLNARVDRNMGNWKMAGFEPRIIPFHDIEDDPFGVLERFAQWLDVDRKFWLDRMGELYRPINASLRPMDLSPGIRSRLEDVVYGCACAA